MFKNELLIKYTEFVYGIYKNVYKMYTKRILSIYRFLIGPMTSETNQYNHMQPISPCMMSFFYNPPSFLVNYHITCEEVPVSFELVCQLTNDIDNNNEQVYNYVQPKNYVFYHAQLNTKKIYRVTCELASSQFLNKRFYNIDYNQQNEQQHQQEIPPTHLKFHLKQFLTHYLTPKEIYKQNLHGNMMQNNFNNEVVDGPPSFQNDTSDYTQGHENDPALLNLNDNNIQQGV
jgi:hypothetical protein